MKKQLEGGLFERTVRWFFCLQDERQMGVTDRGALIFS
ncbi:hypothetical protein SFOMI_0061 [Sphingobium fuliginis]|uniref:Uncharacterized protein n=1 Tax=Sphingobium fuliginis (strain ATCC 27551) TaxID=336203 RepID=A0A292YUM2_SPHSA|nr:hypothetical protein SFOMI_0061 [Sphingobium fuliginis]